MRRFGALGKIEPKTRSSKGLIYVSLWDLPNSSVGQSGETEPGTAPGRPKGPKDTNTPIPRD